MNTPQVIIVGGGFGGLEAARALRDAPVRITILDRTNHHVFQPLLYQVATATLPPTDITAPIRWLVRRHRNTEVLMIGVAGVDPLRRTLTLDDGRELAYDYLILAAGASHSYFSHPEWEANAPGLKTIADAIEIRRRFLTAFEAAEAAKTDAERDALLTFVLVGGGPTGVELAGMIPTIAKHTLAGEFHRADPRRARVILVEAGSRILPTFPESLSDRARRDLVELGVDVRTGVAVTSVSDTEVMIGDERIATRTVFWAAGNAASPLGKSLGATLDRAGRVLVDPDLSVPGHPEIFVVGDMAAMRTNGAPVPGVAPAAMQSGALAARNVLHDLRHEAREEFRYRNKGDLATIGRNRAVAVLPGDHRIEGRPAWWFWLFLHIMYLAGFRNRLSVLIQWAYAYFTYQRGARLVAERKAPKPETPGAMTPRW